MADLNRGSNSLNSMSGRLTVPNDRGLTVPIMTEFNCIYNDRGLTLPINDRGLTAPIMTEV